MKEAILSSQDDAISQTVKNCTDIILEIFDTDVGAKVELSSDDILNTVSKLDVSIVYEVSQLPESDVIMEQQFQYLNKSLPGTSSN